MTEYWVSTPRQWCRDCKMYIDNDRQKVIKHERGAKHQKNAQKRRDMLWSLSATPKKMDYTEQLKLIDYAARTAHKNDDAYRSQFRNPPEPAVPTKNAQISSGEIAAAVASKGFALPPGMASATAAVWLYKDDAGVTQGPWRLGQVVAWRRAGFLGDQTSLRSTLRPDDGWRPFAQWAELTGEETGKSKKTEKMAEKMIETPEKVESGQKAPADAAGGEEFDPATGRGLWREVPSVHIPAAPQKNTSRSGRAKTDCPGLRVLPAKANRRAKRAAETQMGREDGSSSGSDEREEGDAERRVREAVDAKMGRGEPNGDDEVLPIKLKARRRRKTVAD